VRLIALEEFRAAADVFQRAYGVAHKAGIRNTYVIPSLPWQATALRKEARRMRESDPARCRKLLKQARAAASQGRRLARRFRNDLPHALRELALIAGELGQQGKALRLFDESEEVARQQNAQDELEQTIQARVPWDTSAT
jgi:two-component system sensor kinase